MAARGSTDTRQLSSPGDATTENGHTRCSISAVHRLIRSQNGQNEEAFKKVPLAFRNLTVKGPNTDAVHAKTLPRAIFNSFGVDQYHFLTELLLPFLGKYKKRSSSDRIILNDFSGCVLPGEMLFVIGRPGAGCSTFLRTAANRLTLNVKGELSFANIPSTQFAKKHRRETIYLPEEDRHIATLTVAQTIRFALRMSLPKSIRSKQLVEELVEVFGSMFGIGHVLGTKVGGVFVRGISGGECKR